MSTSTDRMVGLSLSFPTVSTSRLERFPSVVIITKYFRTNSNVERRGK